MNDGWPTINNMIWNLTHRLGIVDILDIIIMAVIFYEVLILLRRTRSSALLKGLFLMVLIVMLSSLLGLTSLNWLMTTILNNGAVVLLILFQPEIRKGLEKMGRSNLLGRGKRSAKDGDETERITSEIIQTMLDLSHRRVGALICFEGRTGLQDYIDTGTRVDAEISAPLLENIFEPNTPLHDGAVMIRGTRVEAAACILPLTEASGVSRELVEYLAKSLVDQPDQVVVTETEGPEAVIVELNVAPEDMGKVIGKQGRIAKAIRTVVKAAASRIDKPVFVEIQ